MVFPFHFSISLFNAVVMNFSKYLFGAIEKKVLFYFQNALKRLHPSVRTNTLLNKRNFYLGRFCNSLMSACRILKHSMYTYRLININIYLLVVFLTSMACLILCFWQFFRFILSLNLYKDKIFYLFLS